MPRTICGAQRSASVAAHVASHSISRTDPGTSGKEHAQDRRYNPDLQAKKDQYRGRPEPSIKGAPSAAAIRRVGERTEHCLLREKWTSAGDRERPALCEQNYRKRWLRKGGASVSFAPLLFPFPALRRPTDGRNISKESKEDDEVDANCLAIAMRGRMSAWQILQAIAVVPRLDILEDQHLEDKKDLEVETERNTVDDVGLHAMKDLASRLDGENHCRQTFVEEDDVGSGLRSIGCAFDSNTTAASRGSIESAALARRRERNWPPRPFSELPLLVEGDPRPHTREGHILCLGECRSIVYSVACHSDQMTALTQ